MGDRVGEEEDRGQVCTCQQAYTGQGQVSSVCRCRWRPAKREALQADSRERCISHPLLDAAQRLLVL